MTSVCVISWSDEPPLGAEHPDHAGTTPSVCPGRKPAGTLQVDESVVLPQRRQLGSILHWKTLARAVAICSMFNPRQREEIRKMANNFENPEGRRIRPYVVVERGAR